MRRACDKEEDGAQVCAKDQDFSTCEGATVFTQGDGCMVEKMVAGVGGRGGGRRRHAVVKGGKGSLLFTYISQCAPRRQTTRETMPAGSCASQLCLGPGIVLVMRDKKCACLCVCILWVKSEAIV